jgi:Leucine-rich repeat (LRR) protein
MHENQFFFRDLQFLDISFNNLDNSIFNIVKKIPTLKILNLSGNLIDVNIPNLDELVNLKELILSHNRIESFYLKSEEDLIVVDTKDWKRLLKTNISEFYKKLSNLKNLKILNLSHNKIHFFDIDTEDIQNTNGFANLEILDISYNTIEDEIAILLVLNINSIKTVDLSGNPIVYNKQASQNVALEMNNKHIKILNDINRDIRNYIIKQYKVPSYITFHKSVKSKINDMLNNKKKMEIDVNYNSNSLIEILEGTIPTGRQEKTFITKKENYLPPIDMFKS